MKRILLTMIVALVAFVGVVHAQISNSTTTSYAVRTYGETDNGDAIDNLYQAFDPDTVVAYSLTISVTDSSSNSLTFDARATWKGSSYTLSHITKHSDAEYWFPPGGTNSRVPDSVFAITWDKPGDGDVYSYVSSPLAGMQYDKTSRAGIVIEAHDADVHAGDVYEVGFDSTFAANDTMFYGIVLPTDATFQMHVQFEVSTSAGAWFNIIKGDSVAGGADTVSIGNVNWAYGDNSELDIYRVATVTETGTEMPGTYVGAGRKVGGEGGSFAEYVWVGGVHKHHVFRFVSLAATNLVTIRARWSEYREQ